MPWVLQRKDIAITKATGHPSTRPNVAGRALDRATINFSAAELYGAAARCSHLHVVNPIAVTPESEMMKALFEHHVDDTNPNFFVLPSANNFKDFVANHFFGSLGSALAYLAMSRNGYVWCDHFENLARENSASAKAPDFVFARDDDSAVALVESKATRKANSRKFDNRVADGYLEQVEPHLGYLIGNTTASHGFCIGAWLTSATAAELYAHHTEAIDAPSSRAPSSPTPSSVQQNNFATAFRLAHGSAVGDQVRRGYISDRTIPFFQFNWLDREWLASSIVRQTGNGLEAVSLESRESWEHFRGPLVSKGLPMSTFAIEKRCALEVLSALRSTDQTHSPRFELEVMPPNLRARAREEYWGAVFADGLAVISSRCLIKDLHPVTWFLDSGQLGAVRTQ